MASAGVEKWLPVVGHESTYEVSDRGRVRRSGKAARTGAGRGGGARIGLVLKDHSNWSGGGYRSVQLWSAGKPSMHLVHRLVAQAFIGPIPPGHEVNHIDGTKHHNVPANLEYVTRGGNLLHAYKTGLQGRRSNIGLRLLRRKPRSLVPCACGCGTKI